jgi:FAD/FMN-containing dehydrogenase/Fe-S oxidoreductase
MNGTMPDVPLPVVEDAAPAGGGADVRRVVGGLADRLAGEVRLARHDRMLYATDASIYQVEPLGVVIPRTVDDVETTVRFCAEHDVVLLPRGGGTSLAGQTVNAALVIDFSPHLRSVREIDAGARRARVEPGVVLDDLNRALAPRGLAFGPDVATSTHATLGGMIGNNSAGAHSILYGRTVEHVHALDVLLADGSRVHLAEGSHRGDPRVERLARGVADVVRPLADEIDRRYPRTRRRVNGYNLDLVLEQIRASDDLERVNLAHLLCGSEGTLGVTVEATVGLVDAPACKGLAIVAFPDVDRALEAVQPILETGPAAVELIDDVILRLAAANLEYRRYVELLPPCGGGRPGAVLYVEHFADDAETLGARFEAVERLVGAESVARCLEPATQVRAWKLRKAGEPLLHGQPGARKPITFIEDTAVPPERLPEFVRRFRAIVTRHGTSASYYAHASVGCLHIRPLVSLTDPDDVEVMRAIVTEVTDLVMEFGGALSGEHGDGRLRSHLLERFYGPAICDGFRAIKALFDPDRRLNPGIITAAPDMTERLRVRPGDDVVAAPAVRTYYRYEREHGLGGAVELCNGAGVCRKTTGGTMCPSYRATLDERHATRGRGNALRLAVTGQLSADGTAAWNDPETLATLDLCLSCKACKSECPSNVDVARLKAEYLAQGYDAGARVPPAARAMGHVRRLNRMGSAMPRLVNAVARLGVSRALASGLLGIDRRRTLPQFAPALSRRLRERRGGGRGGPGPDAPAVVLFPDCFTAWQETAVAEAAVAALEALGYRVVVPDVGCCGRALISMGRLDRAVALAARTAGELEATLSGTGAAAIVGCEPSCLSAITDDWRELDLPLDRDRVDAVAARAHLVEDFIETRWEDHPRSPARREPATTAPILVHGHCHQKALWGTGATLDLLRRVTGRDAAEIDSGCCGMAGSFGFMRDHYDLSMRIAELALFPALRAAPDAIIAAPGTSCRHQIRDGTTREAHHPIQLVAAGLSS